MKYVFLDTQIYLHYKQLDELPLEDMCEDPNIVIVVPAIVIRELDIQKTSHTKTRIKDRAKSILHRVENSHSRDGGLNGRPIRHYTQDVRAVCEIRGLDPGRGDDCLIASILLWNGQNLPDEAVLISADTYPRIRAREFNIRCVTIDDKWRLDEPDPQEIELRKLRQEIETLKNSRPKFSVSVPTAHDVDGNAVFRLSKPPPVDPAFIANELTSLKLRFPNLTSKYDKASVAGPLFEFPPEEVARYNSELHSYFRKYERYLRASREAQSRARRSVCFSIRVENIGTAPADEVDVLFFFPDLCRIRFSENMSDPAEPRAPKLPRSRLTAIFRPQFGQALEMPPAYRSRALEFEPELCNIPGRREIRVYRQRLKHGDAIDVPEVTVWFDSFDAARTLNVKYTIRPANLPNPFTGTLTIKITKD